MAHCDAGGSRSYPHHPVRRSCSAAYLNTMNDPKGPVGPLAPRRAVLRVHLSFFVECWCCMNIYPALTSTRNCVDCCAVSLCPRAQQEGTRWHDCFKQRRIAFMALKPGPKPIAKSTGKPDQRRRDNKTTPGNTPSLKSSKSSKSPKKK
jgi:hypothetical protein